VADWPRGTWRFWAAIPPDQPALIASLRSQIIQDRDSLGAAEELAQQAANEVGQAQQHLDAQKGRLFGDNGGPAVADRPEFRDGLVAVIRDEERARDQLFAQLADLRRRARTAYEGLREVLENNAELASQLTASDGNAISAADR
jgi:hypothetical protein